MNEVKTLFPSASWLISTTNIYPHLLTMFLRILKQFCFRTILILCTCVVFFGQAFPASAETLSQTCKFGIFLTSLHDLKPPEKSFSADFWLWSLCPSETLQPLKNIDIIKSRSISSNANLIEKRGDLYWSQRNFQVVFQQNWNVNSFPFDRQVLNLEFEDINDSSKLVFATDTANSGYSKEIKPSGFQIKDFKIQETKYQYPTTFGDPSISVGSTYSRIVVSIAIARNGLASFFKLNTGTYVAFALSLLSFFLTPIQTSIFSARMSLLVGSLFAVVINLRALESVLGRTEGLTLVDNINIITMVYIFASAMIAILSQKACELKREKLALRYDRYSIYLIGISYVVINFILITTAAIRG